MKGRPPFWKEFEMDWPYNFLRTLLHLYLVVCVKNIKVTGREYLLPGTKIIVANHSNLTDGFILPFIVPEKLHFLIQNSVFDLPLVGALLAEAGQIPVL